MPITLSQLSTQLKNNIATIYPNGVWFKAEINQMNVNRSSGHCYVTLIEKSPLSQSPIAKISANIWRNNFERIAHEFEQHTQTTLREGIEIVAFATIDYSPVYGLSVNISRIDPTFNLGQLAQQRTQTIAQLKSEGIINMNKLSPMPSLPFRIAIISSETAAGYEDFIHQLNNHPKKYPFSTTLFQCLMQGEQSPASMLNALDEIADEMDNFDCIAIIRGGGSASDLLAFDNIDVARVCAQFPLPIITGIGHTRDQSILDMVAHLSLKTPTAVAAHLIEKICIADETIENEAQRLANIVQLTLENANNRLANITNRLPYITHSKVSAATNRLDQLSLRLHHSAKSQISRKLETLDTTHRTLRQTINSITYQHHNFLNNSQIKVNAIDPAEILKKGFTFTEQDGKTITSAKQISPNSTITTHFHDGTIKSTTK